MYEKYTIPDIKALVFTSFVCFRSATVWGHQSLHAKRAGWTGAATGWARHRPAERGRWGPVCVCVRSDQHQSRSSCSILCAVFYTWHKIMLDFLYSNLNCVLCLAWCYGERMRDGERGWFPASCATEITNPTAMENNVQRMKRLRKETNVWVTL